MTNAEKKYLYSGFKKTFQSMGFQITYLPLKSNPIQNKYGKIELSWDDSLAVNTWGNYSTGKYQDYDLGRHSETSTERRIAFLISDFETFSISPKPQDALDIVIGGITKRFVIVEQDSGADFPFLFYVANVDSIEHINP